MAISVHVNHHKKVKRYKFVVYELFTMVSKLFTKTVHGNKKTVVCLRFQVVEIKHIDCKMSTKKVLKMWIIIYKRHFLIFLDNCTHKSIRPRWRRYNSKASAKWKEVKGKSDRLIDWYWKLKLTCRKVMIIYNSHPWIMLSFNWLVIIWRERRGGGGGGGRVVRCRKLDLQGQGVEEFWTQINKQGWGSWKMNNFHGLHMCIIPYADLTHFMPLVIFWILKTSGNLWFLGVFTGYTNKPVVKKFQC